MKNSVVTVFGGTGFVGRHVVRRLAAAGAIVRVAVRDFEEANFLKVMGDVGQVVPTAADITDMESTVAAIDGADCVVNLVGRLYPSGKQSFERVHVDGAKNVADAAQRAGVKRFVHLSAIGADETSPALYARTKAEGEAAVLSSFPEATILRPAVIFGPEDNFFNLFAGLARFTWVMPVFGCPTFPKLNFFTGDSALEIDFYGDGGTKFQPVYVGDIADAVMAALSQGEVQGKTFELGGPTVYSSKEIMELLLAIIRRRRMLVPIWFWILSFYAFFLEKLPTPLITRDQIKLLAIDNVVAGDALTLTDLQLTATSAESILPTYLARFRLARDKALHNAY